MISFIILCIIAGAISGFFGGLLGIGGGTIIMPISYIILENTFPNSEHNIYIAICTSLITITFTGIIASYKHYRLNNLELKTYFFIPYILISSSIMGYIITFCNKGFLKYLFAISIIILVIKSIFKIKIKIKQFNIPTSFLNKNATIWGSIFGTPAIIGLSGGIIIVPTLHSMKLSIKKAIGSSSFLGIFVSLIAGITLIIKGLSNNSLAQDNPYFIGYMYLPLLIAFLPSIFIFTQIGAIINSIFNKEIIFKLWIVYQIFIATYMILY